MTPDLSGIRDELAFAITQIESQLNRVVSDSEYWMLGEDARMAVDGIRCNVSSHLRTLMLQLSQTN